MGKLEKLVSDHIEVQELFGNVIPPLVCTWDVMSEFLGDLSYETSKDISRKDLLIDNGFVILKWGVVTVYSRR